MNCKVRHVEISDRLPNITWVGQVNRPISTPGTIRYKSSSCETSTYLFLSFQTSYQRPKV